MTTIQDKFHGVFSLALIDLAFIIAIYSIALQSIAMAGLFTLLIIVGFGIVIYSFCTKCSSNKDCGHVLLGPIAQKMPKKEIGNYKTKHYLGALVPILILVAIPQYWIWQSLWSGISFWALFAIAGSEVNKFVCTKCNNRACALCKKDIFKEAKCK